MHKRKANVFYEKMKEYSELTKQTYIAYTWISSIRLFVNWRYTKKTSLVVFGIHFVKSGKGKNINKMYTWPETHA